jgi:hypothetical protein
MVAELSRLDVYYTFPESANATPGGKFRLHGHTRGNTKNQRKQMLRLQVEQLSEIADHLAATLHRHHTQSSARVCTNRAGKGASPSARGRPAHSHSASAVMADAVARGGWPAEPALAPSKTVANGMTAAPSPTSTSGTSSAAAGAPTATRTPDTAAGPDVNRDELESSLSEDDGSTDIADWAGDLIPSLFGDVPDLVASPRSRRRSSKPRRRKRKGEKHAGAPALAQPISPAAPASSSGVDTSTVAPAIDSSCAHI